MMFNLEEDILEMKCRSLEKKYRKGKTGSIKLDTLVELSDDESED